MNHCLLAIACLTYFATPRALIAALQIGILFELHIQYFSFVSLVILSAELGLQVRILRKLHHRNIVQFYGACLEPGSMFFVTELMKVSSRVDFVVMM